MITTEEKKAKLTSFLMELYSYGLITAKEVNMFSSTNNDYMVDMLYGIINNETKSEDSIDEN